MNAASGVGSKGIGLSLVGLVLIAVLPLLVFGGGAGWMLVNQERLAVADQLSATARALQVAVDRHLLGQFSAMAVLATDFDLDSGQLAGFQKRAQRAIEANPAWLNVGLIDPHTHRIVVGSPAVSLPPPQSLAPDRVDEVVRTRQPLIVGAFANSRITHGPVVLLLTPVMRGGEVRYVLGVALDPQSVGNVFAEQGLAASWTGSVIDANMNISGRSRNPERYVGRPATPSLAERIGSSDGGMFTALTQEGAKVYTVFSRSPLTRWSMAIGVPATEVEGPIRRMLLQLTVAGSVLMVFALILTGLTGRLIVRRRNAYEEALQASRSELQASLQEFSDLVGRIPLGVYKYRMLQGGGHRFDFVSARWCEQIGVSAELAYRDVEAIYRRIHPDDLPEVVRLTRLARESLQPFVWEGRIVGAEGLRWMHLEASASLLPNGDILWDGIQYDITERQQAEQQLGIAATAFEAQEGMVVTDAANVVLRVNQAFTEITGYTADEVIGRKISLLKSGRHDAAFYRAITEGLQADGVWRGEIWNRRKNGEVYPEWLTITAVRGAAGEITHYVGTLVDITLRKAAEEEIEQLAFFDPLTRLPNRRLLLNRLRQALAGSQRSGGKGALLFIDLDNFKTLNDTLGHDVGDLLLQQVAERLAGCVRESDTVARLGGDEFVVMLEELGSTPAEAALRTRSVGEKILATLNQSYLLAGRQHQSTPSIGAALFKGHETSIDELLKRADLAMYQAKAAGRNTLRFFDPEMQAAVTARASLEADLRLALERGEFVLHYQPQVNDGGSLTGVEALVRWQHPQQGLISPACFIPLAEETGLILPLGYWVLESACRQQARWAGEPATANLVVAVNVSARQFHHPDFLAQVHAVLERTGADPRKLKLELTESLLLDNVDEVVARMVQLKAQGIGFSLDDFGTGYSSLAYLKRLPLDQLKIDASFVRDILHSPNDAAIARTIMALAHSMALEVIAEGVETEAQRAFLASLNCRAYQGYLFDRPLPVDEFERRWRQRAAAAVKAAVAQDAMSLV